MQGAQVTANPEDANAALLYLILTQGKGGVSFNPETIPTKVINFPATNGSTVQFKVFVDEYGSPIGFRRQADDDNVALVGGGVTANFPGELNEPPFVTQAQITSGNRDKDDPEGRLRLPPNQWYTAPQIVMNGQSASNVNAKVLFLSFLSQPNQQFRPFIVDPFDGRNRGPFVFSKGRDTLYPTDDDLYSHRIQRDNKGN
jgi:hypothetical protein